MAELPQVIVFRDSDVVNVIFQPDLPEIVKYHLKHYRLAYFLRKKTDEGLLRNIRAAILDELQYLVMTGQLYFLGEWKFSQSNTETSFKYNMLNFQ